MRPCVRPQLPFRARSRAGCAYGRKTVGRSAGALRGWRRDLRLSARAPCFGCRSMRCAHSLGLPCRKSGRRGQARVFCVRGRKKPRLRPHDAREGSSPNGRDRLHGAGRLRARFRIQSRRLRRRSRELRWELRRRLAQYAKSSAPSSPAPVRPPPRRPAAPSSSPARPPSGCENKGRRDPCRAGGTSPAPPRPRHTVPASAETCARQPVRSSAASAWRNSPRSCRSRTISKRLRRTSCSADVRRIPACKKAALKPNS